MTAHQTLALLRAHESRNVTYIEPDGSWPIVWERARGAHVWDASGKKYLDLTAAFGVAAAGHANPRVVRAGQRQMSKLLHAMGDVHPHALKAKLARELSRITFGRWAGHSKVRSPKSKVGGRTGKTIFCNSGFEAVEAALKTAFLATGKPGVIAFEGGYHGLGYGALNVTQRAHFRSPFRTQLREFGHFVPFPTTGAGVESVRLQIERLLRRQRIGAILVEPVQVRGGIHVPPPQFLPMLRRLCDRHQALLILDEIYTGFGRTGAWFACEHSHTVPDLICLGKALTGGFPLSACVGRAEVMDTAWPPSSGEAIHTSTYLGHPVGCAMALAQIHEIKAGKLVQRSAQLGKLLLSSLQHLTTRTPCCLPTPIDRSQQLPLTLPSPRRTGRGWPEAGRGVGNALPGPSGATLRLTCRGLGLLVALELRGLNGEPATEVALKVVKDLLRKGFIFLPEGEHANVIGFTPPLTVSEAQLRVAVNALASALGLEPINKPRG